MKSFSPWLTEAIQPLLPKTVIWHLYWKYSGLEKPVWLTPRQGRSMTVFEVLTPHQKTLQSPGVWWLLNLWQPGPLASMRPWTWCIHLFFLQYFFATVATGPLTVPSCLLLALWWEKNYTFHGDKLLEAVLSSFKSTRRYLASKTAEHDMGCNDM